jgi:hypothetical protein
MAVIGWIIGFCALFAGLGLRQDAPVGGSNILSDMLIALALLACPMLWRGNLLGVSRKQRVVCALILVFCVPVVLLPAA